MFNRIKDVIAAIRRPGKGDSSTYMKYPPHYDFKGMRVLNLGCGSTVYKFPNVVNLDYLPGDGIDCIFDLSSSPLPFKDGEFDFIIANMVLEHIPNWWECFKELARVVKYGGMIEVWLPGDGGSSQLGYRDHINTINSYSFGGVGGSVRNKANIWEKEEWSKLGDVANLVMFPVEYRLWRAWWIQIMPASVQLWMAKHLRNIVAEVGYKFKKIARKNG